jgi:hypothetical protein
MIEPALALHSQQRITREGPNLDHAHALSFSPPSSQRLAVIECSHAKDNLHSLTPSRSFSR